MTSTTMRGVSRDLNWADRRTERLLELIEMNSRDEREALVRVLLVRHHPSQEWRPYFIRVDIARDGDAPKVQAEDLAAAKVVVERMSVRDLYDRLQAFYSDQPDARFKFDDLEVERPFDTGWAHIWRETGRANDWGASWPVDIASCSIPNPGPVIHELLESTSHGTVQGLLGLMRRVSGLSRYYDDRDARNLQAHVLVWDYRGRIRRTFGQSGFLHVEVEPGHTESMRLRGLFLPTDRPLQTIDRPGEERIAIATGVKEVALALWNRDTKLDEARVSVLDERQPKPSSPVASPGPVAPHGASIRPPNPRAVFVVHGRNLAARDAMFHFLRALRLEPLEWGHMMKATGKASPLILEVINKGFELAQAVVVLLTGDDLAQDGPGLSGQAEQLRPQPRPNVLVETGMSLQRDRARTILVEFPGIRWPTDLHGLHTVRVPGGDETEFRNDVASRLETAGCPVDRSGADWLRAGDFKAGQSTIPAAPRLEATESFRSPQLVLTFLDQTTRVEVELVPLPGISNETIGNTLAEERARITSVDGMVITTLGPGEARKETTVVTDMTRLERHLEELRGYLIADSRRRELESRTFEVTLVVTNTGTAPARSVDVYFDPPKGVLFHSKMKLPDLPERPMFDAAAFMSIRALAAKMPDYISLPSHADIRLTGFFDDDLCWRVGKLRPGDCDELTLYVQIDPTIEIRDFLVGFEIRSDDLARPVLGQVTFGFRPPSDQLAPDSPA